MIVITGAAGFIASNYITRLNLEGFKDLILVDDFTRKDKELNYLGKTYKHLINRDNFDHWLKSNQRFVQYVFHLGARTDTAEFDNKILNKLNLSYSKRVWEICAEFGIPLLYASSAATYGGGEQGYKDSHDIIPMLKPLNPYGISKNEFDKWVLVQKNKPSFWAGLKFFNVYGPNEYHKGRMASVIFHAYHQIKETGQVNLFRSHHPDFKDGEQLRDFIYVKDVVSVLMYMMEKQPESGLYNLGTGKARSFVDLAKATFAAAGILPQINFVDTPEDIRNKYQYFTEANMSKLISSGYDKDFYTLENGVQDYVVKYLSSKTFL